MLDSNQNTFAIELQRNPDRSNEDEDEDGQSEEQESENDGKHSYFANVTREISLNEKMDDESEMTSKHTPANSLKSIQEMSDELRAADTCLEVSTSSSTAQANNSTTGENGQVNLLAVVQDSSMNQLSKQQQSSTSVVTHSVLNQKGSRAFSEPPCRTLVDGVDTECRVRFVSQHHSELASTDNVVILERSTCSDTKKHGHCPSGDVVACEYRGARRINPNTCALGGVVLPEVELVGEGVAFRERCAATDGATLP